MTHHAVRRIARVFTLIAALLISAPGHAADVDILWVYGTSGGYLDSSPAITDLDGDGSPDICITSLAGPVFVLDAFGREIWSVDLKERIAISPTAFDVSGDDAPEVLVLTLAGKLYCLEGRSGDVIWIHDIPSGVMLESVTEYILEYDADTPIKHGGTTIVAADINADGVVEVVTSTVTGTVVCLDASGNQLWTYDTGTDLQTAPAVGDLDGDGVAEIVVSSLDHPIICLDADGSLRWKYDADPDLPRVGRNMDVTSPVMVDLDGDGSDEVVTFDENTMVALDADGSVVWKTVASRSRVDATLTAVDADQDGSPEIYAVDLSGDVVRVNADGTRMWTTNIGQRCRRGFSVADVDGDGVMEIIVSGYTYKIHIFTPDGVIEEELDMGPGTNATSTVADLLGDGSMCLVTPEITGNLTIHRWEPGIVEPKVLVSGYRGGNTRTASSFVSQTERTHLFESLSTGSIYDRRPVFSAEILNPAKDKLSVELSVADENGTVAETRRNVNGKSGRAHLPYDGDRLVGNVEFTCSISNSDGVVEAHTFTHTVVPYLTVQSRLREQVGRIASLIPELPDERGVAERHAYLLAGLHALGSKATDLDVKSAIQLRELRDELTVLSDNLAALETLSLAARDAGAALVVSAANPWAPFGGMEELSENRMGGAALSVEAFEGEVESAALNIWNFSGVAKTLRVKMGPLTAGDESTDGAVTVREVLEVATQRAKMSADAIPGLNGSSTIVVPAWGARQIWLEIRTADLAAGEWTGEIHLRNMAVGTEEVSASLTVNVWSVAQSREHVFNFCGWHNTSEKGVLEDMLSHGMNVFTDGSAVPVVYDVVGNILSADYTALDSYMVTHAPEGTAMFHSFVHLKGPAEQYDPVWSKAYDAAIKQFAAHILELGFDYDDYAYYPVDEPGLLDGPLVERFMLLAPLVRNADSNIRIYTNPGVMPLEWLAGMDPFVDIYSPGYSGVWHDDPDVADLRQIMHEGDHELWTYTCADNAKHLSPLGYSRAQMWGSFNDGHTGGGMWTYSSGNGENDWHTTTDYNLVYRGVDGPVPSKRWEAVRDGTEDYSMLMALKTAADSPGADPVLAARARALLAGDVVIVGNYWGLDDDGVLPGKEGMPAVRKLADRRYAKIVSVRRKMRDILQSFGE
jgi:outer membrane protein assembly factor BamB